MAGDQLALAEATASKRETKHREDSPHWQGFCWGKANKGRECRRKVAPCPGKASSCQQSKHLPCEDLTMSTKPGSALIQSTKKGKLHHAQTLWWHEIMG